MDEIPKEDLQGRLEPPELPRQDLDDFGDLVGTQDRVSFFVDGATMDHVEDDLNRTIDWVVARDLLRGRGQVISAHYFTLDHDEARGPFLRTLGRWFNIHLVRPAFPAIDDPPGTQEAMFRMLVSALTAEAVSEARHFTVAFLFTTDSGLAPLVKNLRGRGKRVFLVTSRTCIPEELLPVVDKPVLVVEDHEVWLKRFPDEADLVQGG